MGTLYLHLGLHKTGTTTLQEQLFPFIEDIEYLKRDLSDSSRLYARIAAYCFRRECTSGLEDIRRDLTGCLSESDLLLSEEWFTSNYSALCSYNGTDWQERLKRLSNLVKGCEVRILLTIREPIPAVYSYYCEMCKVGASRQWPTLGDFIIHSSDVACFDFKTIEKFILKHFSVSNITYLKFEDLKASPEAYKDQIFDFLGYRDNCNISLQRSNMKKYNKQGVSLMERSFLENFAMKLARSVPSIFKIPITKSVWVAFMFITRYFKIKHHVPYPNEFEAEEIRRRCSSTVTLYNSV